MRFYLHLLCIFCSLFLPLFGQRLDHERPCFGGTLLAEWATTVSLGTIAIEPFIFVEREYGIYSPHSTLEKDRNDHVTNLIFYLNTGITKDIDVSLYLDSSYISYQDKDAFEIGDTVFLLGFQMSREKKETWIPNTKFYIGESFPTGKYDNLGLGSNGVNGSGSGSYATWLLFAMSKIFYTWPNHPYKWNLNLYYLIFTPTSIRGVSVYGGNPNSRGIVRPGHEFIANLAFEYKFNKDWGWGIDAHFKHKDSSSFYPKNHIEPFAGLPSSDIFSLAPELEHCFSDNLTMTAGCWFSVWGRNAIAFQSFGWTLYYEF